MASNLIRHQKKSAPTSINQLLLNIEGATIKLQMIQFLKSLKIIITSLIFIYILTFCGDRRVVEIKWFETNQVDYPQTRNPDKIKNSNLGQLKLV